ncbi:hypothetical protein Tco_0984099 [Tanacetum coccineum]
MTTAGTKAVVNTGKGKMDIDLKKSKWVWRPKGNYLDHVSKDLDHYAQKLKAISGSYYKKLYASGSDLQSSFKLLENVKFVLRALERMMCTSELKETLFLLEVHKISLFAPVAHEKSSKSSPKDNDVQDLEDVADKEGQHQMTEDKQVLHDELEKMIAKRDYYNLEVTDTFRVSNTPTGINAGEPSFVYLGGKIPIDASTLPNADLPIDPNMPDLEDAFDTLPNDRIFNGAYDDDKDVGVVADFNNMDNTIAVSPIPTLTIHKDHPKGQILGDPTSAVQTRGKIQKASSAQQALKNPRLYHNTYKMKAGYLLICHMGKR